MSSQLRDLSTVVTEQNAVDRHHGVVTAVHPRGMGFRVLSRMARSHAEEETAYVPRHRLDAPVDSVNGSSAVR